MLSIQQLYARLTMTSTWTQSAPASTQSVTCNGTRSRGLFQASGYGNSSTDSQPTCLPRLAKSALRMEGDTLRR